MYLMNREPVANEFSRRIQHEDEAKGCHAGPQYEYPKMHIYHEPQSVAKAHEKASNCQAGLQPDLVENVVSWEHDDRVEQSVAQ